jgi:hypothetical protein
MSGVKSSSTISSTTKNIRKLSKSFYELLHQQNARFGINFFAIAVSFDNDLAVVHQRPGGLFGQGI